MRYVRLTARKGGWFKEGTEVFDYDSQPEDPTRMTLDEWRESKRSGSVLVRGIRVPKLGMESFLFGGGERWDGELCDIGEFDWEETDDPR